VIKPAGSQLNRASFEGLGDSELIRPGKRLVIDFSDVEYISSAALVNLIQLKNELGRVGGRLGLRHVRPELVELLRITRLDQVLELEP
jgi:anti-sigma B factor antagonist